MSDKIPQEIIKTARKRCGSYIYQWASYSPEFNDFSPNDGGNYVRAVQNFMRPQPGLSSPFVEALNLKYKKNFLEDCRENENIVVYDKASLPVTKRIKTRVNAGGLLGLLGFKKEETSKILKVETDIPLNKLIHSNNYYPAYNVFMNFKTKAVDGAGRPLHPGHVVYVGNQEDTKQIYDFLKGNPSSYINLIKETFPEKEFPNVNNNLLSKIVKPEALTFIDLVNKKELTLVREEN